MYWTFNHKAVARYTVQYARYRKIHVYDSSTLVSPISLVPISIFIPVVIKHDLPPKYRLRVRHPSAVRRIKVITGNDNFVNIAHKNADFCINASLLAMIEYKCILPVGQGIYTFQFLTCDFRWLQGFPKGKEDRAPISSLDGVGIKTKVRMSTPYSCQYRGRPGWRDVRQCRRPWHHLGPESI